MQRYFITQDNFMNQEITNDFHHIKNVMRMQVNDEIIVVSNKKAYLATIQDFLPASVRFVLGEEVTTISEFPFTIDIVQGYAKGEKMEYIVQKATELGVTGIYPTLMQRSIVKLEQSKRIAKEQRLSKIAKEAAEQSHRVVEPKIYAIEELKKIDFSIYDIKMIADEESAKNDDRRTLKNIIENINPNDKVVIVIGPEGGIDSKEITYLQSKGFVRVGLGPRILRTETASLYFLSALSYAKELKI